MSLKVPDVQLDSEILMQRFLNRLYIYIFSCLFSLSSAPPPKNSHCNTLDGVWYNQLGSEIILHHTEKGKLSGEYRSAVERLNGSAGVSHSIISGQ